MPSRGQYPFPTHTPSHCASGGSIPTSGASITHTPLQEPPAAHLGQQDYDHASQHLKRDHGSLSSASTDSSRQTAPHPSTDPTLIYAPAFSLSPQAEVGVMGSRRLARAHPNQCTRPSRSEMVEVDGAYHYTYEEDDSSEELQDHAIWVLVCHSSVMHCIVT